MVSCILRNDDIYFRDVMTYEEVSNDIYSNPKLRKI